MKKRLITVWFLLQCGAVLYSARIAESRDVKRLTEANQTWIRTEELNRVTQHAKELMGPSYNLPESDSAQSRGSLRTAVQEWTRRSLKGDGADRVSEAILAESQHHGIDPAFLMAVIERESRFNPRALGSHGEIGLMQIQPSTAGWIAQKYHLPFQGADTLKDPVANVRIGAAYLSFLRARFKARGELYLAAYNMGPRKMRQSISNQIMPKQYATEVLSQYVRIHSELSDLF